MEGLEEALPASPEELPCLDEEGLPAMNISDTASYSVEEAKQKAEQDNLMATAEAKKAHIRQYILQVRGVAAVDARTAWGIGRSCPLPTAPFNSTKAAHVVRQQQPPLWRPQRAGAKLLLLELKASCHKCVPSDLHALRCVQIRKEFSALLEADGGRPEERQLAAAAFQVDQGLHELVAQEVAHQEEQLCALHPPALAA
jgi:hypothetical protein